MRRGSHASSRKSSRASDASDISELGGAWLNLPLLLLPGAAPGEQVGTGYCTSERIPRCQNLFWWSVSVRLLLTKNPARSLNFPGCRGLGITFELFSRPRQNGSNAAIFFTYSMCHRLGTGADFKSRYNTYLHLFSLLLNSILEQNK